MLGQYLSLIDFQFNHLVLLAMGGCSIQLASQQLYRVLADGSAKLEPQVVDHVPGGCSSARIQ